MAGLDVDLDEPNRLDSDLDTITATYEVVTPMFLAGAHQDEAEFRLPSFKGALRFWWRALAWRKYDGDLSKIWSVENSVFGSPKSNPDHDNKTDPTHEKWGQSKFQLRTDFEPSELVEAGNVLKMGRRKKVGPGARYFGYGLMEAFGDNAGELSRPCIAAGDSFEVKATFSPHATAEQREAVKMAFRGLGLFGGLGSRSQNGWGSVALTRLDGEVINKNQSTWQQEVLNYAGPVYSGSESGDPAFSAFSKNSKVYLLKGTRNQPPLELLNEIGKEMVRLRSWGFQGQLFGFEDAERNFEKDHDILKAIERREEIEEHPDRIAFGLPHTEKIEPAGDTGRRNSPLHIKMMKFEDNVPGVMLTFLPAQFLPEGMGLKVGNSEVPVNEDNFWAPIRKFLNRTLHKFDDDDRLAFSFTPQQ